MVVNLSKSEIYISQSDWELILACKKGDEDAWSTLIARYDRLLYYILRQYGLPPEEIVDIIQLTFMNLLEKIDTIESSYNVKAWLKTVAKRQAWRYLDKRRREDVGATINAAEIDVPDYMDTDAIDRNQQNALLHESIHKLNDRCRELLISLYFDDPTPSYEILAESLDMPVGSIGPNRARCLQKLKKILETPG